MPTTRSDYSPANWAVTKSDAPLWRYQKIASPSMVQSEIGLPNENPAKRRGSLESPNVTHSDAFENCGNALTAADTHGHQGILSADALQFVQRLGGEEGAGTAHRVTQGDGAAVGIGLGRIEPQHLHDGQGLGGEGFVGLDDVHLVQAQAS